MDIKIVTQVEFHQYARETKSYFHPEEYHSDYFQRFLAKNSLIKNRLAMQMQTLGLLVVEIEIRHNADNPQELILVISEETHRRLYGEDVL